MKDELIKRRFLEDDTPSIVNLFNEVFSEKASIDWFKWKYLSSPWGSVGYVAIYKGKIVCFYGGLRQCFYLEGQVLWAYQVCDVMTQQDFRGKIFSKTPIVTMLGEMFYKENDMDFAYGFPSIRHARLQALRLGGEGYRLVSQFTKQIVSSNSNLSGINEGWQNFKSSNINNLLNRFDKNRFKFYKNSDYLKWRYFSHPLKQYSFILFKGLIRNKGFAIYTVKDDYANLVEFKAKDLEYAENFLNKLESYLIKTNIKGINIWCHQNSSYKDLLIKLGYNGNTHIPIAFKKVKESLKLESDFFYDNFFYSMGDYDAS
ncbi:MAG TPA: GNAT family N-acetyltransferase [Nitrospirae bacterium]|nr:GNAT family N-acetyltransferase [Nitrospirota bacterium]